MNKSIRVPAEWELQKCIWTCWPSAHDLWEDNIDGARAEIGAMIKSIIAPSNKKSTPVKLLVATQEAYQNASACLPKDVELFLVPFGDIWLRDTGPIFVKTKDDELALCFGFNGWGGKYSLEYDDEVNGKLAESANCKAEKIDFILEGGSIDG
ncbi:MAG: agmatine deiminase family protein, partial [Caulobacterales bacterium]|nr:agmatine deiminase family protein [Caulobacterales bacterium]